MLSSGSVVWVQEEDINIELVEALFQSSFFAPLLIRLSTAERLAERRCCLMAIFCTEDGLNAAPVVDVGTSRHESGDNVDIIGTSTYF